MKMKVEVSAVIAGNSPDRNSLKKTLWLKVMNR